MTIITLYELPNIDGIIVPFVKTPKGIVCPHFYELRWAFGCPFDCAYCYLQGTGRGNKRPRYRSVNKVLSAIEKAFKHPYFIKNPTIFNSGELADSLMNPTIMEQIADKFEEQDKHKLLLLTKGVHSLSKIDFLINKPRNQTIVSLSLNSQKVWKRWEHLTPPPAMRIEIAKRIMEVGYEVRIRIDPIFPIDNWKRYYEDLIYSIFSELPESPERITLGTPRGLKKTIMFSQDKSWTKWFKEYSKWGWKLAASKRKEIYLFFLDKLDMLGFDKSKISLCKETEIMWNELGMDRNNCKCNCVW